MSSVDPLDSAARDGATPRHSPAEPARKHHILTVVMEDYYHVSPLKSVVERGHWSRFEKRLEIGTRETLSLLDEFGIRATFFVLGWVADAMPSWSGLLPSTITRSPAKVTSIETSGR